MNNHPQYQPQYQPQKSANEYFDSSQMHNTGAECPNQYVNESSMIIIFQDLKRSFKKKSV